MQTTMHYDKLVPADSFLGRYLRFMSRQETATAYDFWCGLFCIACACGRDVYVARPRAPVYLNMYLILIGDSGIPRKTTSVHTAGGLLRDVYRDHDVIGYLDAKMTAERLNEILHERTMEHESAQLCIAIPELAVFMGIEQYVANMPTLLTDLYDCPSHRHGGGTIYRGESIQRNVWLSFLSASTPIWLLKTVNPNVVEGGFTSRCIFVVANQPKQSIPWPDAENTDYERDALTQDLRAIRFHAPTAEPITLTDNALVTFRAWYDKRTRALDPYKQSFEAREDAHVLRVAALLSINDNSWEVEPRHLAHAIKLVAGVKASSAIIFENAEQRTKYSAALDAVRMTLVSTGMDPVARHVLNRKVKHHLRSDEVTMLLDVLHELGAIQKFTHQGDRGPPTHYYRGTELLLARGLGEDVLAKFT